MVHGKRSIAVIFKIQSIENKKLNEVKDIVILLASEYRIALTMSQLVDTTMEDDEVVVEYYSKAKANETIDEVYLSFLDKFLDIGHKDKVNTVPME